MIVSIHEARALVERCMTAVGHTQEEAEIIADHLIDCELRGLAYGGLARALSIIEHIRSTTEPRRPITLLQETPISASFDGGGQVGYLVGRKATETAIAKAATHGMAVVGASKTWYTGMYSYYLERVTSAGYIGMIAGSGSAKVAPHGGTEPRFSTNPIAFGFPSTTTPVIWDIGTSNVMLGEVTLTKRLGELLKPGLAFDRDGAATREPDAALRGAFTVWGGHRGSGLAMVVQMLAMVAGQAAAPLPLQDCGFLIVIVDPALLTSAEDFRERVAAYADDIRRTRPVDPQAPVRVPFDRSIVERRKRLEANAIEVPDAIHDALLRISTGGQDER